MTPALTTNDAITQIVFQAISEHTNLEPDELNLTDHLEEDLYLSPEEDLPKIMTSIQNQIETEIPPSVMKEFLDNFREDPSNEGSVSKLVTMIKDELEF